MKTIFHIFNCFCGMPIMLVLCWKNFLGHPGHLAANEGTMKKKEFEYSTTTPVVQRVFLSKEFSFPIRRKEKEKITHKKCQCLLLSENVANEKESLLYFIPYLHEMPVPLRL